MASPTLGDVIRAFGDRLRAERGEHLTSAQEAILSTLGRCHSAALGGHVYRCDGCGAEEVAFNGCGNRHCPSCLGHKRAQWLTARTGELLPVPYYHVVFTIPEQLSALALGNKRVVYTLLFQAVGETLREIAADPEHLGAEIGVLAILHTWTQTLMHHPHVHCVVPGGGLSPDGQHWIACRPGFFLPVLVLSALFRGKLLAALDQARSRGRLRFGGSTAPLAKPAAWAALLAELGDLDWVVYAKPPFGTPEQVLKYLARYTHRVAISNGRILGMDADQVRFRYRDRAHGDKTRVMSLGGTEFLRRFLLHVLPAGFVRIRYFGWMAQRHRAAKLARCRELLLPGPMAIASLAASHATTAITAQDVPKPSIENALARRCTVCGTGALRWVRELPAPRRLSPSVPRAPPPGRLS